MLRGLKLFELQNVLEFILPQQGAIIHQIHITHKQLLVTAEQLFELISIY